MNIVSLVSVFLLLISILTYGQLYRYRQVHISHYQFMQYSQKELSHAVNYAAMEVYKHFHNSREGETSDGGSSHVHASSKLSWLAFLRHDLREQNRERAEKYLTLVVELIDHAYKDHPFIQELKQQRPNCLREMFETLMQEDTKKKIGSFEKLRTVEVADKELNELLYFLLKGYRAKSAEMGVMRLDALFTMDAHTPIRLQLAREDLLSVIYQSPDVAKQIIKERRRLIKEVQQGVKTGEKASQEFAGMFRGFPCRLGEGSINFTITAKKKKNS